MYVFVSGMNSSLRPTRFLPLFSVRRALQWHLQKNKTISHQQELGYRGRERMEEDGLYGEFNKGGCGMQKKEVEGLHVDGGAAINNLHKALLDGTCNIAGAHGQEVVGFGQGGVYYFRVCRGVCCGQVADKGNRWTSKGVTHLS